MIASKLLPLSRGQQEGIGFLATVLRARSEIEGSKDISHGSKTFLIKLLDCLMVDEDPRPALCPNARRGVGVIAFRNLAMALEYRRLRQSGEKAAVAEHMVAVQFKQRLSTVRAARRTFSRYFAGLFDRFPDTSVKAAVADMASASSRRKGKNSI